jgi:CheY-like chemotaxis protein
MGCTTSSRRVGALKPLGSSSISDRDNEQSRSLGSVDNPHNRSHPSHTHPNRHTHAPSIQDEARSFRSKTGAIKMLARNELSFNAFLQYLTEKGKNEFLICYRDMEEIKSLDEDQMISRTAALIWRYKTIFETMKANCAAALALVNGNNAHVYNHHGHHGNPHYPQLPSNQLVVIDPNSIEYLIWECFGKLRYMDVANAPAEIILKYLLITQNEILSRLVIPFEGYLQSTHYKKWQEQVVEAEKLRRQQYQQQQQQAMAAMMAAAAANGGGGGAAGGLSSVKSVASSPSVSRRETCSSAYPHILVVDDSTVTLKITGLTLERDGHQVDRAHNGQIALEKMKSRSYDVVLIDCNMPVMDGFEAVRLFREYEQNAKIEGILYEEDEEDEEGGVRGGAGGLRDDEEELDKFPTGGAGDEAEELSSISNSDEEMEERMKAKYQREKEKLERKQRILEEKMKRREARQAARQKAKEEERLRLEQEKEQEREQEQEIEHAEGTQKDTEIETEKENENEKRQGGTETGTVQETEKETLTETQAPIQSPSKTQSHTEDAAITEGLRIEVEPPLITQSPQLQSSQQGNTKFHPTILTREHYHQLIIGMSTDVDEETQQKALSAGMDYFLPKPFTLEKFIETIRLSREDMGAMARDGGLTSGGSVNSQRRNLSSKRFASPTGGSNAGMGAANNSTRTLATVAASNASVSNVHPQFFSVAAGNNGVAIGNNSPQKQAFVAQSSIVEKQ